MKIRIRLKNQQGFTLVEQLIVMAIIGVLVTVTVPSYINSSVAGARTAKIQSDLAVLDAAAALYEVDHYGAVPQSVDPDVLPYLNAGVAPRQPVIGTYKVGGTIFTTSQLGTYSYVNGVATITQANLGPLGVYTASALVQ